MAPQYVNWNYTYSCNQQCLHCYSRSPVYPEELSLEWYKDISSQIVEANVFTVGFGGGEPTLRKDLVNTVTTLSEGGVDTHLTSNGWNLSKLYLNNLMEADLGQLLISIDSPNKSKNDKLRNNPGSFDRACTAIRMAKTVGLRTFVASVASAENIDNLAELVHLAESLGADGINFKVFRPVGGAVLSKARFDLAEEKKLFLSTKLQQLKESSNIEVTTYQDSAGDSCSCGVSQLTLRPNGDVSVCPYSSDTLGNLTNNKLTDLWKYNSVLLKRRKSNPLCMGNYSKSYPYNPSIEVVYSG